MATMKEQPWYGRLTGCFTVTARVGARSKAWHCQKLGVDALVDVSGDILQEAHSLKIKIFPVVVTSKHNQNYIYSDLAHAARAYLLWQDL